MKLIRVAWSALDGTGITMEVTKGSTIAETKEYVKCVTSQTVSRTGCLSVETSDAIESDVSMKKRLLTRLLASEKIRG